MEQHVFYQRRRRLTASNNLRLIFNAAHRSYLQCLHFINIFHMLLLYESPTRVWSLLCIPCGLSHRWLSAIELGAQRVLILLPCHRNDNIELVIKQLFNAVDPLLANLFHIYLGILFGLKTNKGPVFDQRSHWLSSCCLETRFGSIGNLMGFQLWLTKLFDA